MLFGRFDVFWKKRTKSRRSTFLYTVGRTPPLAFEVKTLTILDADLAHIFNFVGREWNDE